MCVFTFLYPLSSIDLISSVDRIIHSAGKQDLVLLCDLPAFADDDMGAFLNGVAHLSNLLKKVCTLISSAS